MRTTCSSVNRFFMSSPRSKVTENSPSSATEQSQVSTAKWRLPCCLPSCVQPSLARLCARRPVNLPPLRAVRLLDQLRERVRMLHYSRRTEQAYLYWSRAFIRFHGLRHPAEMDGPEVEAFLTYLASDRGLSPSSHRQALSALLFLYGKVPGLQLPWMQGDTPGAQAALAGGAQRRRGVVCACQAAGRASIAGATAVRHRGCASPRPCACGVKDIDFAQRAIYVRQARAARIGW